MGSTGHLTDRRDLGSQWDGIVRTLRDRQITVLCLYNGGSILNSDEMDLAALLALCRRLADIPFFRRLVLETRPEFAQPDSIMALLNALGPAQSLMLGIGIETANDVIRQLCLNKGLARSDFESIPHTNRCLHRFYCFFGAPFLTEAEMLTDTFDSLLRFRQNADEISVESATIQRGTLLNRLWRNDLYELPSLWSLVFLLRAMTGAPLPDVGTFQHFPMPYQIPTTCKLCEDRVVAALQTYNEVLDPSCFDGLACPCLDSWVRRIHETDVRPLEQRVLSRFEGMDDLSGTEN